MNDIVYVGRTADKAHGKNYTVVIPDGKEARAVIIPPKNGEAEIAAGLRVVIEKALLSIKSVTVIEGESAEEIAAAVKTAEKYFSSGINKRELILAALGELIAGYAAAFCAEKGFSPAIEAVRREIIKNVPNSTFNLEDELKKLPLNYDYVRKTFKKEVGVTPHEFLLSERMKLARSLILGGITNRYSEFTVSQLAEACGYSDPLYFSRVFKRYYGVSPKFYKE